MQLHGGHYMKETDINFVTVVGNVLGRLPVTLLNLAPVNLLPNDVRPLCDGCYNVFATQLPIGLIGP